MTFHGDQYTFLSSQPNTGSSIQAYNLAFCYTKPVQTNLPNLSIHKHKLVLFWVNAHIGARIVLHKTPCGIQYLKRDANQTDEWQQPKCHDLKATKCIIDRLIDAELIIKPRSRQSTRPGPPAKPSSQT